jgi:hypothetical protein
MAALATFFGVREGPLPLCGIRRQATPVSQTALHPVRFRGCLARMAVATPAAVASRSHRFVPPSPRADAQQPAARLHSDHRCPMTTGGSTPRPFTAAVRSGVANTARSPVVLGIDGDRKEARSSPLANGESVMEGW